MNAGVTVTEFRMNVSRVLSKCRKEYKRPPYTIAYFKGIWIKKEQPKTAQVNVVLHMPEVGMLIRHLDLLYSKMMINQQQDTQTISWFNPGQGAVKQSQSVN